MRQLRSLIRLVKRRAQRSAIRFDTSAGDGLLLNAAP
jgi:hypothetical protein